MKEIALVTIVDYKNYGNRLQNYAAQIVLESLGNNVTSIINKPKVLNIEKKNIQDRLKGKTTKDIFNKIIAIKNKKEYTDAFNKKVDSFKSFTKNNIKESNFTLTDEYIPQEISNLFDYYIVGSDQVWNPQYRNGSAIDFLTFAPKDKRIAYAPSFGIELIPEKYLADYKKWLSEFSSLSVRENTGAKIIKNLTDRDAPVIVDPTLMLRKEEWMELSTVSEIKPHKNFILTYFLGEISIETKKIIKLIKKEYDYEVVNLGSYDDIKYYAIDPSEFIDYINTSSIFLTDSFHGAVFSIIFEKPFIVFDRIGKGPTMNSRIETLLAKFKLEDRKWKNIRNSKKYFDIDYSHIEPILNKERNKALSYLEKALEVKGEE